jgi:hypothetical protein
MRILLWRTHWSKLLRSVPAYGRVGAQQGIHTEVTEVRKGSEGLKGFRIYEELDFAGFGALAEILCAVLRA